MSSVQSTEPSTPAFAVSARAPEGIRLASSAGRRLAKLSQVEGRALMLRVAVDGGGRIRQFFAVTVPGVRPATFLVVLLSTITGANLFTEPYLLTSGGGPNGASTSPVLLIYQKGIEQQNPDVAAAIGVVLIIFVLVIALLQRRFVGREES